MKKLYYVILILIVIGLLGCTNAYDTPVRVDEIADAPEIPRDLRTEVGDGTIQLSWSVNSPSKISQYFIYRGDTSRVAPVLIDSTTDLTYSNINLRNNLRYIYQVSSLGKNGLEGKKSQAVSATPTIFSITINSDDEYTNTRDVTIISAAPPGARLIQLSNSANFVNAKWLTYSQAIAWELDANDGVKTVYANLRDFEGNETVTSVSDDIILDTKATISTVTENSNGLTLKAGDILHLSVNALEVDGDAGINIEGLGGITLYDDGSLGDVVANDGIYEFDYTIPIAIDLIDATLTGGFSDAAGNRAEDKIAATVINVANPPTASSLTSYTITESSIDLVWTRNNDSDFSNYLIFRSESSIVDTNSTLIRNESSSGNTNYTDTDLQPSTDYYYVVYSQDLSGLLTKSNTAKSRTDINEAPEAITLFISAQDTTSMTLGWTRNNDDDFDSYRVYRSMSTPVSITDANLVAVISTQNSTSFTDNQIKQGEIFYYKVVVFDKYEASTSSNEVQGPNP